MRKVHSGRTQEGKGAHVDEVSHAGRVAVGVLLHLAGKQALVDAAAHHWPPSFVAEPGCGYGQRGDFLIEGGQLATQLVDSPLVGGNTFGGLGVVEPCALQRQTHR